MSFNGRYSVIAFDQGESKQDEVLKFSNLKESSENARKLIVENALEFVKEHEKDQQFVPCFDSVNAKDIKIYPFIPYDKLVLEHENKFKYGVIIMESEKKDDVLESYEILKIETNIERSFKTMFFGYTVKKIKLLKVVAIKENLATSQQMLEELSKVFAKRAQLVEQSSTTGYDEEGKVIPEFSDSGSKSD